jgi:hypothetical protein
VRLGKLQSPIDIRDGVAKKADLPAIMFDYKPSPLAIVETAYHPGELRTWQFPSPLKAASTSSFSFISTSPAKKR